MDIRKRVNYLVYRTDKKARYEIKNTDTVWEWCVVILDSQVSCLHLTGGSELFLNFDIPIPDYTAVYPITE
jgi:hypothetical protein